MTATTPKLFEPVKLRDLTLPNRVVVSPMCTYSATDGLANEFHLVHLGQFALGGAGLILAEATAVSPEGRISPEDLGLWDDRQIVPLGHITDFVHRHGGKIGVQLAHAGRKASTYAPGRGKGAVAVGNGGWEVVGPDTQSFHELFPTPRMMGAEDILGVVEAFAAAARQAPPPPAKLRRARGPRGSRRPLGSRPTRRRCDGRCGRPRGRSCRRSSPTPPPPVWRPCRGSPSPMTPTRGWTRF